jgi:hypothetical protein
MERMADPDIPIDRPRARIDGGADAGVFKAGRIQNRAWARRSFASARHMDVSLLGQAFRYRYDAIALFLRPMMGRVFVPALIYLFLPSPLDATQSEITTD